MCDSENGENPIKSKEHDSSLISVFHGFQKDGPEHQETGKKAIILKIKAYYKCLVLQTSKYDFTL